MFSLTFSESDRIKLRMVAFMSMMMNFRQLVCQFLFILFLVFKNRLDKSNVKSSLLSNAPVGSSISRW